MCYYLVDVLLLKVICYVCLGVSTYMRICLSLVKKMFMHLGINVLTLGRYASLLT